ncbi:uncharacterized protein LOC143493088 [Brachyhypopomus gauderio]|uniref:uncharacterized protein LOC143493088 n=1 Tax=Brachyhypopomus gauderio TaxID=698409 RepID=UPI0040430DB2
MELAFGAPHGAGSGDQQSHRYVQLAQEHQGDACGRQKTAYGSQCQGDPPAPGVLVWLYNPRRRQGRCPKLQSHWEGSCEILSRLGEVVYRVRSGRCILVVHRDRTVSLHIGPASETLMALIPLRTSRTLAQTQTQRCRELKRDHIGSGGPLLT